MGIFMEEIWKDVAGYSGYYEVSNLGRLRSVSREQRSYGGRTWTKPEKMLNPTFDGRYMVVSLCADGKRKRHYVHEVVLTTFVGPRPEGAQGCHGNGDGKDNCLANLRWDTPSANTMDKHLHGRMPIGERHHKARYTENQILQVKRLLNEGKRLAEIEAATGVPTGTINQVKHGRQWKHLTL